MFRVDLSENRLVRLRERRFADLNLRERDHLQEWLVRMPDALGEELLIVQKEFDGFADTRERLDLLALDKEGRLVVVENKLDDSGRDVVWQALKYVAYCSSLKKAEIVEVYQNYLDRWSDGADAAANLCAFLDVEELDDVVLNAGNEQRLVLIAANFRKEVTATVLWLLGHGVRAQCFRVVPYSFGEELFIDLQQIIPTPEAADYMIGMAAKDSETQSVEGARKRSDRVRHAFWTKALEELRTAQRLAVREHQSIDRPLAELRDGCIRLRVQPDLPEERGPCGAVPSAFRNRREQVDFRPASGGEAGGRGPVRRPTSLAAPGRTQVKQDLVLASLRWLRRRQLAGDDRVAPPAHRQTGRGVLGTAWPSESGTEIR